jgi:hypothetical protein
MLNPFDVIVIGMITGALELVAHWFPYRRLFHHEMPRLVAYTIGTVLMLTPACVYLGIKGLWDALIVLAAAVFFSGAAVVIGYGIDMVAEHRDRAEHIEKLEELHREND